MGMMLLLDDSDDTVVGEPTEAQLRVVAPCRWADDLQAVSGSNNHFAQVFEFPVGDTCDCFVFNLPNRSYGASAEINPGNPILWTEIWAKRNNTGSWVQVPLGAAASAIADGDFQTLTAALFASQFGISNFLPDDTIILKVKFNLPSGGDRVICSGYFVAWANSFQIIAYDNAVTTISACNVDGDFTTVSGTPHSSLAFLTPIIVFGRPANINATRRKLGFASSIGQGFGDEGNNDFFSKGYLARSSHNQNAASTAPTAGGSPPYTGTTPILNFARGASHTLLQTSGTGWQWYCRFVDTFVSTDGANDFQNYASAALIMAAQESVITEARTTEGSNISKVIVVLPAAFASSSNNFLTAGGQTPVNATRWGEDGWAMQVREAYVAHIMSGFIDGLCFPHGIVDPDQPWLFLTDNVTPNLVNYDTIHWNGQGNEAEAETLRTQYTGVWQNLPFALPGYAPTITGTLGAGNLLTGAIPPFGNMTPEDSPSYAYGWTLDGVTVSTALTYMQEEADAGKAVRFFVVATNSSGSLAAQYSEELDIPDDIPSDFVERGLIADYFGDYDDTTGIWPDATGISGNATQATAAYRAAEYTHEGETVPNFQNTGALDADADWMTLPAALASLNNGSESTIMVAFIPDATFGKLFATENVSDKYNYELATDRVYSRVRDAFNQMLVTVTTGELHVATLVNASGTDNSKVGFDNTFDSFTRGSDTTATGAYLGRGNDGFTRFKGKMLRVRIHNVALTDEEIQQNLTAWGI